MENEMKGKNGTLSAVTASGALMAAILLLLGGCSGKETESATSEKGGAEAQAEAVTDPYQPGAPLPPNHPPIDISEAPQGEMPPDHPVVEGDGVLDAHPPEVVAQMKDIEVVVPENVKEKWQAVELAVSAGDEAKNKLTVPVGGQVDVAKDVVVTVDAFLPDYTSDFEKATSASDSLNNPAVLVHLTRNGETVAKGWVFKNFPEFNTFSSEELKIELLDAKPAEK